MDYAKIEWLKVSRTEDGDIENVLIESDGRLALTTLTAHFACAIGLIYKAKSKELFAVDKRGQYLLPPEGGWVPEQIYFPVFGPCKTTSMKPDGDKLGGKRDQIADLFQKVGHYFDSNITLNEQCVLYAQDNLINCLQIQLAALRKLEAGKLLAELDSNDLELETGKLLAELNSNDLELETGKLLAGLNSNDLVNTEGDKPIFGSACGVNNMEFESSGSEDDAGQPSNSSNSSKSSNRKDRNLNTKELYITVHHSGNDAYSKGEEIVKCLNSDVEFCNIIENKYNIVATLAHVKFESKEAQRKALSMTRIIGKKTEVLRKMRNIWETNFRVDGISSQTSQNHLHDYFSRYAKVEDKYIPRPSKGYGLVKLRFTDVHQLSFILHGAHFICGSSINLVTLSRRMYNRTKQGRPTKGRPTKGVFSSFHS